MHIQYDFTNQRTLFIVYFYLIPVPAPSADPASATAESDQADTMARLGPYLALVACIGVACLAGAAFADGPPKASPRRADIPLIKCALCERLATKAWRSGRALLKTSTPAKRVDELAVVELIEKLGTPWRPEGEWLTQLDIVREGKALALVDKDQVRTNCGADVVALMNLPTFRAQFSSIFVNCQIGECNTTCKTLAAAAEDILGSHDTDIAEMIYVVRGAELFRMADALEEARGGRDWNVY